MERPSRHSACETFEPAPPDRLEVPDEDADALAASMTARGRALLRLQLSDWQITGEPLLSELVTFPSRTHGLRQASGRRHEWSSPARMNTGGSATPLVRRYR